ncbi:ATP-dependent DNA helicase RecQ [Maribacter sp. R77961]|uniref:ATP-dependent DNA helicase RecQ n=1 Tax=Maribacter sp. R77961 TaxID=3093871 RepID=UPI0037C834DA
MNKSPEDVLEQHWGFTQFRGSQKILIQAALDGNDVLGLLPTGGGKSICFQVPAMMKKGICIVISPLIALIQNQVEGLKKLGIKAIGLTGGLRQEEIGNLLDNCIYGNYKFLYLSPERLSQELVQQRIAQMNVNLLVIDEAHCISQWGHDFRPAYLICNTLRALQPNIPIMALTATATSRVAKDIIEKLELSSPLIQKDSFLRKNIAFRVVLEQDKKYRLRQYCSAINSSGIVYVRTRRLAEELSKHLLENKISATFYHGGVPQKEKKEKLEKWLQNKVKIMVATNAFGMGIDKPDVSLVLHYQIPDCIENYFQEAGRAGRDGNKANAILITNDNDKEQVKNQFLSTLPDKALVKLVYNKLNNYFQIAYGEFNTEKYQLNFNDFCATYKLNTLLTYNALNILDRNSVISLITAFSRKSTVQFITDKETLFDYLKNNTSISEIIRTVLRTYGGIFEHEIKINTALLSKKLKLSEKKVTGVLEKLSQDGLIIYKGKHSDLEISFLVPREDDLTINKFASHLKEQNNLKTYHVNQMLAYIANHRHCRSKQLLQYFGEKATKPCGICDVCISKENTEELSKHVQKDILTLLKSNPSSSRTLQKILNIEPNIILLALQGLLENGKIKLNSKNQYTV